MGGAAHRRGAPHPRPPLVQRGDRRGAPRARRPRAARLEQRPSAALPAANTRHITQESTVADVELPQLGESVTEGVITAWLVEVGDEVDVDQPIVEISTDKVDTEIPSPVAGTVQELRAEVDDTIEVGQVIAVIGAGNGGPREDEGAPSGDSGGKDDDTEDEAKADDSGDEPDETEAAAEDDEAKAEGSPAKDGGSQAKGDEAPKSDAASGGGAKGEKALTSPLVRRLLREAGIDTTQVQGTGPGGRITREDAEKAIAGGGQQAAPAASAGQQAAPAQPGAAVPPPSAPAPVGDRKRPEASPNQIDFGGQREVTQDLSRVRKATANAMMNAMQSTAQLTAAVEVDVTGIMNLRAAYKDAFKAKEGVSLSPLPIISRAVTMVLPRHPGLNSTIDMDSGTATYHNYINLGMAVDTEAGLLVPNIKDAQDLTVPGLARRIGDLAGRARSKKLQPDDISGATFTITNTGSRGTLWDTPIFTPPQVAILATCAIEKRAVVVSDSYGDSIAIRWMTYLCLSYDHRMVDGADTARFLQDLKYTLETHDFSSELGL
ncbi:MAG: 2-oxoglutarate dehydrogenase, E2 component, dihydrolipoamide succinyltransferase [Actinobacteria bacterium]|nr:2-oxoglutarate dehydrogenase, E2 component, dihydrolipoamide succinyltransferase [Actinomycetota bacterium]